MALEDFVDPEVGIAVAATAAIMSPRVRGALRTGLVYGLAGVFRAADTLGSAARGVADSAGQAAASTGAAVQEATTQAQTGTRSRRSSQTVTGAGSE